MEGEVLNDAEYVGAGVGLVVQNGTDEDTCVGTRVTDGLEGRGAIQREQLDVLVGRFLRLTKLAGFFLAICILIRWIDLGGGRAETYQVYWDVHWIRHILREEREV